MVGAPAGRVPVGVAEGDEAEEVGGDEEEEEAGSEKEGDVEVCGLKLVVARSASVCTGTGAGAGVGVCEGCRGGGGDDDGDGDGGGEEDTEEADLGDVFVADEGVEEGDYDGAGPLDVEGDADAETVEVWTAGDVTHGHWDVFSETLRKGASFFRVFSSYLSE